MQTHQYNRFSVQWYQNCYLILTVNKYNNEFICKIYINKMPNEAIFFAFLEGKMLKFVDIKIQLFVPN